MKKIFVVLALITQAACATSGVTNAPMSGRIAVSVRNNRIFERQNAVVLLENQCAATIKAFAVDHTDVPIVTLERGGAYTLQLNRPYFTSVNQGYTFYLLIQAFDKKGKNLGSSTSQYYMNVNQSGQQNVWTVNYLANGQCTAVE